MAGKKDRTQLQTLFKTGAKPSEGDFKDLINSLINAEDDGIEKPSGIDNPLKILAHGDSENLLDFYAKKTHTWRLNQKPTGAKTPGLNFETGGVSKLFIDSASGNVGLSINQPTAKLHIQQSGSEDLLRLDDEAGDTTPLVVDAEGNVGIGTASPKHKLDVQGAINVTGPILSPEGPLRDDGGGWVRTYGNTGWYSQTHGGGWYMTDNQWIRSYGNKNIYQNAGILRTDGTLQVGPSGNRFIVNTAGKVGIGEINPKQTLTVVGSYNSGKDDANGMTNSGNLAIKSNAPQIDFIDTDHKDWAIHVNSNKLYFIREPWETTDLVLDGAGKVGIGTASPKQKLDVQGSINVTGAIVGPEGALRDDGGGWVRTYGNTGWYSQTHGGGWYMTDNQWIRSYGNKNIYQNAGILRTDGMLQAGPSGNRFIVNTAGNVGIGTTSPGAKLHVHGGIRLTNSNSNRSDIYMSGTRSLVFTLAKSYHGGNSARSASWDGDSNWDFGSDLRLKTDIENEENVLERLMKLEVKNYRWKDNPDAETKKVGFIAQDVQPLFPSLVGELQHPEDNELMLTLKYAEFGVLAIGGLRELKREKDAEISELKAQMDAEVKRLKAQIQKLKS
ncbi:MAG: shufflon system plasmid conjugative transfer pilus tip adhesin PilV [Cyanobacteria bacterium P01_H01_bin.21]